MLDTVRGQHKHKYYGQNFLICRETIRKIVSALDLKNNDNVLEIGPGTGAISRYILCSKHKIQLTMVEIDKSLCSNLHSIPCSNNIVSIINSCCLTLEAINGVNVIVSNTPFGSSKKIMIDIIIKYPTVKKIVLGIHSSVFSSIVKKGSPFGALIYTLCNIKLLFEITPDKYQPKPTVNTTFINMSINRSTSYLCNELHIHQLYEFLKQLYSYKRKGLGSSRVRKNLIIPNNLHQLRSHQLDRTQIIQLYYIQKILKANIVLHDDI